MNLDIGLMLKFAMSVGIVYMAVAWAIYFWWKRQQRQAGSRGMRIKYDEQDDILRIKFSRGAVVKDVSCDWNVNVGYTETGIAEITVLDAKKNGYWPPKHID